MACSSTTYFKNSSNSDVFRTAYSRYAERLVRLASSRFQGLLHQKLDPEDVVQSALASFVRACNDQIITVQTSQDLWALLATMTLRKCRYHLRRYTTGKRQLSLEVQYLEHDALLHSTSFRQPAAEEVQLLLDLLDGFFQVVPGLTRQIVELSLQNYSPVEIAHKVGLSERTVFRQLARAKACLQNMYQEEE